MDTAVRKIPHSRNVRIVGMLRMNAKLRVWIRMENRGMPAFKTVMKSLSPTETLTVVAVGSLTPLPVCIATENNRARIVAAPYASLGHGLRIQAGAGKVKTLNPKWSVMLSHS
jgi:hypothetical protein